MPLGLLVRFGCVALLLGASLLIAVVRAGVVGVVSVVVVVVVVLVLVSLSVSSSAVAATASSTFL